MRNKDEELRREGMAYALRIAKEKGIDSLEEECRFRGATKLPLALPKNAIDECVSKIKLNTIDTVTICTMSLTLVKAAYRDLLIASIKRQNASWMIMLHGKIRYRS